MKLLLSILAVIFTAFQVTAQIRLDNLPQAPSVATSDYLLLNYWNGSKYVTATVTKEKLLAGLASKTDVTNTVQAIGVGIATNAWSKTEADDRYLFYTNATSFTKQFLLKTTPPDAEYAVRSTNGQLNVLWFGAKGDYTTDDTAAFSNCLATAEATVRGGSMAGVEIYVPPGNYRISNTLTQYWNVGWKLDGKASAIHLDPGYTNGPILLRYPKASILAPISGGYWIATNNFLHPAIWDVTRARREYTIWTNGVVVSNAFVVTDGTNRPYTYAYTNDAIAFTTPVFVSTNGATKYVLTNGVADTSQPQWSDLSAAASWVYMTNNVWQTNFASTSLSIVKTEVSMTFITYFKMTDAFVKCPAPAGFRIDASFASADQWYNNSIENCVFYGGGITMTNVGDNIVIRKNQLASSTSVGIGMTTNTAWYGDTNATKVILARQTALDFETITASGHLIFEDNTCPASGGIIIRGSSFGYMGKNFLEQRDDIDYPRALVQILDDYTTDQNTNNLAHSVVNGWYIDRNILSFKNLNNATNADPKYAIYVEGYNHLISENQINIVGATNPVIGVYRNTNSGYSSVSTQNRIWFNICEPLGYRQVEGNGLWDPFNWNQLLGFMMPNIITLGQPYYTGSETNADTYVSGPNSVGTNKTGGYLNFYAGKSTGTGRPGIITLNVQETDTTAGTASNTNAWKQLSLYGKKLTWTGDMYAQSFKSSEDGPDLGQMASTRQAGGLWWDGTASSTISGTFSNALTANFTAMLKFRYPTNLAAGATTYPLIIGYTTQATNELALTVQPVTGTMVLYHYGDLSAVDYERWVIQGSDLAQYAQKVINLTLVKTGTNVVPYVNAAPITYTWGKSANMSNTLGTIVSTNWIIGITTAGNALDTEIYGLKVFNVALTSNQIADVYMYGSPVARYPSLIMDLDFENANPAASLKIVDKLGNYHGLSSTATGIKQLLPTQAFTLKTNIVADGNSVAMNYGSANTLAISNGVVGIGASASSLAGYAPGTLYVYATIAAAMHSITKLYTQTKETNFTTGSGTPLYVTRTSTTNVQYVLFTPSAGTEFSVVNGNDAGITIRAGSGVYIGSGTNITAPGGAFTCTNAYCKATLVGMSTNNWHAELYPEWAWVKVP